MSVKSLAFVLVGGGFGAVARYVLGAFMLQRMGPGFPYGTLLINVLGCFAIGIVSQLSITRALGVTPSVRIFLAVGVLGGFTTFSSFAYEAVTIASERAAGVALLYVALSVVLGMAAAFLGIAIARLAG